MLKTRIITAFILIISFLIALFNASSSTWALLTLGVILLGVWEWSNLIRLNTLQMLGCIAIALCVATLILVQSQTQIHAYQQQFTFWLSGSAALFWVVIAPIWLASRKVVSHKFVMCMLGLLLLLATWVGIVGLHAISPWLLLSAVATVSIADSAAYFAGKRFGRHKLAPEISPGKTWEGVLGALLAVTVYGAVLCYYQDYSYWMIVGLWIIVVLSVMGDLFESMLKRQAGIKDSSQLLPGHGGVLDRIDGLIPTLAITFFCTYIPFITKFASHG
ncbi:phosphatidate cytidylyltransferase [mine drainage metagenome]|uniref:Phosphatidate cytidylyltransferase n=1 Tax=mine drainage metagenome TaxID=410659 RepID=A0A1J5TVD0_9ZZZZ